MGSGFPSAREGFGLVVVEANACGTPTIATNVPGLRETVKDNETGILTERNVEALAFSIIQILSDYAFRKDCPNEHSNGLISSIGI